MANSISHADFLLETRSARRLYHDYAANMPIIDYHCHLSPALIASNHKFANLQEIWLAGDESTPESSRHFPTRTSEPRRPSRFAVQPASRAAITGAIHPPSSTAAPTSAAPGSTAASSRVGRPPGRRWCSRSIERQRAGGWLATSEPIASPRSSSPGTRTSWSSGLPSTAASMPSRRGCAPAWCSTSVPISSPSTARGRLRTDRHDPARALRRASAAWFWRAPGGALRRTGA